MLRKHARLTAAVAAIGALFTLALSASASVNDFIGVWNNRTPSGGVTQIFIEQDRFRVRVRVFGQCHPRDCDWGWTDAQMYSPSVGGNPWQDAVILTAHYDNGPAHRLLVLTHRGPGGMGYQVLTDFSDNSHRANYVEEGRLDHQR